LRKADVRITPALCDSNLVVLNPLRAVGEDLFVVAARAVGSVGATQDEAEDLVREVRRAKTAEDKAAVVDAFVKSEAASERRAETKGGTVRTTSPSPRDRLAKLIRQTLALLEDFPDKAALRPRGSEFKAVRSNAQDMIFLLAAVFGLGSVPERE